ncbi:uncharacterized protein I303_104266 [Kwoniella dejecticola CBS 10117]|uniref:Uncharacterized protein n=1 Tax=Kwoniella dejecticola CBS 10117 TaxID=1296121 RepID=A0A1A6A5U0_9TREE|nr:uncharacterized protein I303_04757 [Kwoniella dejecticola CBS 10117]OBR85422.1 hypothetical protein I303_04757 [Kwoniella dejecticola CBS 10117]
MAELTPPSSHNSTPVRASNDELPPSPTAGLGAGSARSHPLMKSHSMDLDEDLAGISSPDDEDEIEEDGMVSRAQGEDDDENEGLSGGDEGMLSDEEQPQAREVNVGDNKGKGKGVDVSTGGKGKGRARSKRARNKQQQAKSASGALLTNKANAGAGRKDGNLWESDIVDRWNIEIGDVCAESVNSLPTSRPATASTSTAVPA